MASKGPSSFPTLDFLLRYKLQAIRLQSLLQSSVCFFKVYDLFFTQYSGCDLLPVSQRE